MDKLLNRAIENKLVRKPSQGFSDKVMSQIFELKTKNEINPLISRNIWIGSAFVFTSLVIVSVLAKPQSDVESKFNFTNRVESFFSTIQLPKIDFFMNMNLLIISGIFLALFLLLFFDLVLFRKKLKKKATL
jgi:hypothetical protein